MLLQHALFDKRLQVFARSARGELQTHSLRDSVTALPNRQMFEGTLATIARQLAARSPPAHRGELHEVARLCATDMSAATVMWNLATASLRGRARGEPTP